MRPGELELFSLNKQRKIENSTYIVVNPPTFFDKKLMYLFMSLQEKGEAFCSLKHIRETFGYWDPRELTISLNRLIKSRIVVKKTFILSEYFKLEAKGYSFIEEFQFVHSKREKIIHVVLGELFRYVPEIEREAFRIKNPTAFRLYELIKLFNTKTNVFKLDYLTYYIPSNYSEKRYFKRNIKKAAEELKKRGFIEGYKISDNALVIFNNSQEKKSSEYQDRQDIIEMIIEKLGVDDKGLRGFIYNCLKRGISSDYLFEIASEVAYKSRTDRADNPVKLFIHIVKDETSHTKEETNE